MSLGRALTARDVHVLRGLCRFGALSTTQIERLFFPSSQTALRRLRALERLGHVQLHRTHAFPHRHVLLTARGAEAADLSEREDSHRTWNDLPSSQFLAHHSAVVDFQIALEASVGRHQGVALRALKVDEGRRGVSRARDQPLELRAGLEPGSSRHVPDAIFVLERAERFGLFFVEIDRGTEVVGASERGVGKALDVYLSALLTGTHRTLACQLGLTEVPPAFRVLFITTTENRIASIRARFNCSAAHEAARRFVWLAPMETLAANQDFLESTFVSLNPSDSTAYQILTSRQVPQ